MKDNNKYTYIIESIKFRNYEETYTRSENCYRAIDIRDAWEQWKHDHVGWANYIILRFTKIIITGNKYYNSLQRNANVTNDLIKDKFYNLE